LWETYNLHVENFYNYIKINRELRDLDLKKNYEAKLSLCEQAEELTLESQVVEAFRKLQKLHDEWRETGPVAMEFKEALWERFKEASSRINKRHQEHFESLKSEQTKNLALKTELCEKMLSAIREVSSRGAWVLVITTEEISRQLGSLPGDALLTLPTVPPFLTPFPAVTVLLLLAYHVAVARGCDVDQPRNLAKSVTVE
jgi:hypothetical protein